VEEKDSKLDLIIKEVAVKNGIALGKDDPILALYTMNSFLLNETKKTQEEIVREFKEEFQAIAKAWEDEAKKKAETILNASLLASKNSAKALFEESIKELKTSASDYSNSQVLGSNELLKQARFLTLINLTASVVTLLVVLISLLFF
jgi:vacuolar-type H+-ATPase subunit H